MSNVVALKPAKETETEALFRDLSRPSLRALSYVLRHPQHWPKGFYWGFQSCGTCAMGLAHQLWHEIPLVSVVTGASEMARSFAMPFEAAQDIFIGKIVSRGKGETPDWMPRRTKKHFFGLKTSYISDHKSVTPEMVADQIDAYLKREPTHA